MPIFNGRDNCSPNRKGAVNPEWCCCYQHRRAAYRCICQLTDPSVKMQRQHKTGKNYQPQEIPDICFNSERRRVNANRNKMAEAIVSRHAAITIDGISYPCANRTKIDPAEIPITPKINTIIGKKVEM